VDKNTGVELALQLLDWADAHSSTNSAMDALLHKFAHVIFPTLVGEEVTARLLEGFPSSYYKAQAKLIGPAVNELVEVHMCVGGCELFERVGDGAVDYNEVCSTCGERRYDADNDGRSVLRYVLAVVFVQCDTYAFISAGHN
jgi:hypothetical protein